MFTLYGNNQTLINTVPWNLFHFFCTFFCYKIMEKDKMIINLPLNIYILCLLAWGYFKERLFHSGFWFPLENILFEILSFHTGSSILCHSLLRTLHGWEHCGNLLFRGSSKWNPHFRVFGCSNNEKVSRFSIFRKKYDQLRKDL